MDTLVFVRKNQGSVIERTTYHRAGATLINRPRQNRDIGVNRTSSSTDVGEAESADGLVAVVVPPVGTRVRTPLNHAERQGGAGKGVAIRPSPDEGVHGIVGRIRERRAGLSHDDAGYE